MNGTNQRVLRLWGALGCLGLFLALLFVCLMPLVLIDTMRAALENLHLSAVAATVVIAGIFAGSLINIPIRHLQREQQQLVETLAIFSFWGWDQPRFVRMREDTVIAVNVGGCLIPVGLAAWQVMNLMDAGGWPLGALAIVATVNVAICYLIAIPVNGVGIMMPWLASPVTAIGLTWLLLAPHAYDPVRAPVAFVAGVLGPLVGADLLHLKDITKVSVGMLSIGGAGTFDGIVLSGVLAALLA
ncbi:MAG: DUF1614 domain-containing protein [Deltaproteobacteria bacterium]